MFKLDVRNLALDSIYHKIIFVFYVTQSTLPQQDFEMKTAKQKIVKMLQYLIEIRQFRMVEDT